MLVHLSETKREEKRKKREERREKRSQKRPPEIPKLTDSRVCWPLGRLESKQTTELQQDLHFPGFEEKRKKREEIPKKAARDPQIY